ncbi:hypothetical protein M153_4090005497 [Pseudoloma neurophilia]|uniref:Uncharacterized protein n=1 Tax=Pseudoloma neurophilia TaxID=146866 RepID=A0A0R0M4M8_9MICR|nr:hypothetical protein M153_4090005497 [Pseudoloma neurophilia]
MIEKKKFTKSMTKKLIKLRHSEEWMKKFDETVNQPQERQNVWVSLGMEIDKDLNQKEVSSKYNYLLSKYKTESVKVNKSGAGSSSWVYWNIFNETYPKNVKILMENVTELGGDERTDCLVEHSEEKENTSEILSNFSSTNDENQAKRTKKSDKTNNIKYKLMTAQLAAFKTYSEKQERKNSTSDIKDKEITTLNSEVNNMKQTVSEINNKLDKLFKLLKEDKE